MSEVTSKSAGAATLASRSSRRNNADVAPPQHERRARWPQTESQRFRSLGELVDDHDKLVLRCRRVQALERHYGHTGEKERTAAADGHGPEHSAARVRREIARRLVELYGVACPDRIRQTIDPEVLVEHREGERLYLVVANPAYDPEAPAENIEPYFLAIAKAPLFDNRFLFEVPPDRPKGYGRAT